MPKPWFGPKRYGVGLSPVSWEGWALTAAYVAALAAAAGVLPRAFADPLIGGAAGVVGVLLASVAFFSTVARRSASDIHWRWGKD